MTSRKQVYKVIDGERAYQDKKWVRYDDSKWSIGDWLIFMERYVDQAKSEVGLNSTALEGIRKVAALAVACMEYQGAPKRKE